MPKPFNNHSTNSGQTDSTTSNGCLNKPCQVIDEENEDLSRGGAATPDQEVATNEPAADNPDDQDARDISLFDQKRRCGHQ